MPDSRRRRLRRLAWTALGICVVWDGWMGEDAISPGGCWLGFDLFGRCIETRTSAQVWIPVAGLVLLQALLILALIRLREPKDASGTLFPRPEEHGGR